MSSHYHHPSHLPALGFFCFTLISAQESACSSTVKWQHTLEQYAPTISYLWIKHRASSNIIPRRYCVLPPDILKCYDTLHFTLHREKAEPSISIFWFNNAKTWHATSSVIFTSRNFWHARTSLKLSSHEYELYVTSFNIVNIVRFIRNFSCCKAFSSTPKKNVTLDTDIPNRHLHSIFWNVKIHKAK